MKAMGPIPSDFGADVEGRLLIGGRTADDLVAEAGGTPLFVYDAGLIQQKIGLFRAAMPPEISLHYAVKANPYAPLLSWIADKVDGFDVASAGELGRVAHLGLPISFAGPGKTDQQLETAIRAAITAN
jgi:diaminopimelate decarboxylase